jgi:methionyl-tRNA formyltransferase
MKIAYCGYDFFYGNLEMLFDMGYEIVKIFSFETDDKYNFNYKVKEIAGRFSIPVQLQRISREDIIELQSNGCELLISSGYPFKIPVLDSLPLRGINIHPTLLPNGRGPWPLPYVILNDLDRSGVTIHKLSNELDEGDILIQESFSLSENENLETLSCKCQITAIPLLKKCISDFDSFWNNAQPQGSGTYWSMPDETTMALDWNKSVFEITKTARAFGKFDSCAILDDLHLVVQDLSGWVQEHTFKCGEVVHRTNKEILVAVKDGFVCLRYFDLDKDYQ